MGRIEGSPIDHLNECDVTKIDLLKMHFSIPDVDG